MKIFDSAILDLPFFNDEHRNLADKLEKWVFTNWERQDNDAEICPRVRGRHYTKLLGKEGWFNDIIGEKINKRPDLRSICLIREAFSYLDDLIDFAFSIQTLSSAAIDWFGSAAQREIYIPKARSGDIIGAFSLSEPEVGSDISAISCKATSVPTGFRIEGSKSWISNGDIADFCCVLVRTGEGPSALGLSLFVLPLSDCSNNTISRFPVDFIAHRACANFEFNGHLANVSSIIGEAGLGFGYAMDVLNFYRVSVGAAAIGFSRRAQHAALQWCKRRQVVGGTLLHTQLSQSKFSEIELQLHSSALLVARAAWEYDVGSCGGSPRNSAMAKLHATESAQHIVDEALQLLGAIGLTEKSITAKLYRQVRSLRIYEGTSEIQRMIIAKGMKID